MQSQQQQEYDDDGFPPPPKELMTPQSQLQQQRLILDPFSTPISSRRPAPRRISPSPCHKKLKEEDEDSYISYDVTSGAASADEDAKENALPELLTPPAAVERGAAGAFEAGNLAAARSAPGNNNNSRRPAQMHPIFNTLPRHISHVVEPEASVKNANTTPNVGIPRYTTSMDAYTIPLAGFRVSEQRRLPYTPSSSSRFMNDKNKNNTINFFNSPCTSQVSTFSAAPQFSVSGNNGAGERRRRGGLADALISYEGSREYVSDDDFGYYVDYLQKKIQKEESRVQEYKGTVSYWKKKADASGELFAHALLLLSQIRLRIYNQAFFRAKAYRHSHGLQPISPDVIPIYSVLRMEFKMVPEYSMKKDSKESGYSFIVVGTTGEKAIASNVVDCSDPRSRSFAVDEKLVFQNLPLHFSIVMSVYGIKKEKKQSTPKAVARKLLGKVSSSSQNFNTSFGSRNGTEEATNGYELVGIFLLKRDVVGLQTIRLESHSYPLHAEVKIAAKCSPLPEALEEEVRGRWNLLIERENGFEHISYYIILKAGELFFYEYPLKKDERMNLDVANFSIDCSSITNKEIVPASTTSTYDHHLQQQPPPQNLFCLDVFDFPRSQQHPAAKHYLFQCENGKEFQTWMNALNKVLNVIHGKQQ